MSQSQLGSRVLIDAQTIAVKWMCTAHFLACVVFGVVVLCKNEGGLYWRSGTLGVFIDDQYMWLKREYTLGVFS